MFQARLSDVLDNAAEHPSLAGLDRLAAARDPLGSWHFGKAKNAFISQPIRCASATARPHGYPPPPSAPGLNITLPPGHGASVRPRAAPSGALVSTRA
jgi:hypothetical protein